MKLTPKDYVDSQPDLARAGFKAIKDLLADNSDGAKKPEDIAVLYGIDQKNVELVATTGSYADLEMVAQLELEREELENKVEDERNKKAVPKLTPFQWVWGSGLLIAIVVGIIWLIVWTAGRLTQ